MQGGLAEIPGTEADMEMARGGRTNGNVDEPSGICGERFGAGGESGAGALERLEVPIPGTSAPRPLRPG